MAAERGILMRSGEAFQILKDITHVVLDKTGTITQGKPALVAIEPLGGFDRTELLRLAAAAEAPSEYPLARAVVEAAEEEEIELPQAQGFQAAAGQGIEADVDKRRVLIGAARYLASKGIDVASAEERLAEHEARAQTAILVAVDGKLAGLLAIADAIKPDARDAIAELKRRGIVPVMITGDNRRTAEAVAREVGIEEVRAQVLPQDKAAQVRALQAQGARVAMVGDGINDAPALMQAEVGMAIGAGTDIAIESADVVIISDRVGAVPEAQTIGGLSYRKTVQNLWLAFVFNGVGVPLATTGIVHPSRAMGAMALSVSAVLANSFGGRVLKPGRRTQLEEPATKPWQEAPESGPQAEPDREITFTVPDMHCDGCVETIRANLMMEDGIGGVAGDLKSKRVRVGYRSDQTDPNEIENAISRLGFRVRTEQHEQDYSGVPK